MSDSPDSSPEANAPLHIFRTRLVNAEVLADRNVLTERGHALLGRKKDLNSRPFPDDCSKAYEELTHLFVGDLLACLSEAKRRETASAGAYFGPQCGRSGRKVEVIKCFEGENPRPPEVYAAIACHCSSKRDAEGELVVEKVLLASKDWPDWDPEFKCSYLANCNGLDPEGGLPGGPQVPDPECAKFGTSNPQGTKRGAEDADVTS